MFRRTRITLLGLAFASCLSTTNAQETVRGPYLQLGTPNSVVVRWRTDRTTESVVRYGLAPERMTTLLRRPGERKTHSIPLEGLAPATRYYYTVGESSPAPFSFVTAPPPNTNPPVRIWVLGDSGSKGKRARAVRDAYYRFSADTRTDLWLMLGDNAYLRGTDHEYQRAVFNMYPDMLTRAVLWPAFGNHDGYCADSDDESGVYYEVFTLPREGEAGGVPSGTEAYYSFDYGDIHFLCLDSHDSNRSPEAAMARWAKRDLAASQSTWKIAFFHHPPYSKGSHNSDTSTRMREIREVFVPILEAGGVDLVLSGHCHSYERSFPLCGHYGKSSTLTGSMKTATGNGRPDGDGPYLKSFTTAPTQNGIVYVVAGSSGKTSRGKLNHPAMAVSMRALGSFVIDVHGNRLDARFIDTRAEVRDWFAIVKTVR